MKKRTFLSIILCIAVALVMAVCVYSAAQTRLLTVNAVFDGNVSVYVDGEYLSDAPLSRYVSKDARITLVNSSDDFMFYSDAEGNTFGYDGEYSFNIIGNTTVDAWYENKNTDKVCVIYKNTNDSQQLLASASYKVSELASVFEGHLVEDSYKFGYDFSTWNKTVSDIIASVNAGERTIVVEPIYTELSTLYSVEVLGGYISSEDQNDGAFAMHSSVTIKANEAPEGEKFAYWTNGAGKIISNAPTITVTVISNETYTAHFVGENEEITVEPSVSLAAAYDQDVGKIVTVAQRFLPDEYTIKGYGLIYAKDVEYAENEMTCEAVDGVELKMSYNSSPQSANGIWINRISCETYVCVRAYMIYEDSEGNSYTAYSNSVKSTLGASKQSLLEINFNDGSLDFENCVVHGTAAIVDKALSLTPGSFSINVISGESADVNVAFDVKFTTLPGEKTDILSFVGSINVGTSGDGVFESWDSTESSEEYLGNLLVLGDDGYLYVYDSASSKYVKTAQTINSNTLYKISAEYNTDSGSLTVYVNNLAIATSTCPAIDRAYYFINILDDSGSYSALIDNVNVYYPSTSGECTEHSYRSVVTPNSCEEYGYTTHTCSVCGSSYVSDYVDPIGSHSYGEGVMTDDGLYIKYTCSVCGESYSEAYERYAILYDSVLTTSEDAEDLAARLSAATGRPFDVAEKSGYNGSKYIDISNISPSPESYGWEVNGTAVNVYYGPFVTLDTVFDKLESLIASIEDLEELENAEYTVASSATVSPVAAYAATATTRSYLDALSGSVVDSVLDSENTDISEIKGTVYYVSEDGGDYNDGKSDSYAWKTVSKVNSADLSAGDAVLFKRGDVFRGNVDAVSGVTYGCYGDETLSKPIIVGSKQNYAGLWTEVDDNIWELGVSGIVDPGIIVFGADTYSVDQYDELTGNRIIDTNEILGSSTQILYENDFSSSSKISEGTAGSAATYNSSLGNTAGCIAFGGWNSNAVWTKSVSHNSTNEDITVTLYVRPNCQTGTYPLVTINGTSVLWNAGSTQIKLGNDTTTYNTCTNQWVKVIVVIDPSTGDADITYDQSAAGYTVRKSTVNLGTIGSSFEIKLGYGGNSWYADDLSVTQTAYEYKTGYSSLSNDYDFYWGTPTTTFDTFNQSSNSYKVYVYYSGDLNADFDSIEIGEDGKLFNVHQTDGVTVDGICFKYFGGHGIRGGANVTTDLVIKNCVIAWGGGSILSFNNSTASVSRYGNGIEIFGSVEGMDISNCWIYEIFDTGITFQYQGATNTNDITMSDIYIHNNLVERCYWGLEWWSSSYTGVTNASNINMYDNIVKSIGDSWGLHQHGDPRWGGALFLGGLGSTVADKTVKFYNNIIDCAYVAGYTGTEANPETSVSSKGYRNRLFNINYDAALQVEFTDNYFIQYNDQYIGRMTLGEDHPDYATYCTSKYEWNFCFDADNDELYEFFGLFPYMQGTKVCILERPTDLNQ